MSDPKFRNGIYKQIMPKFTNKVLNFGVVHKSRWSLVSNWSEVLNLGVVTRSEEENK